MANRTHTMKLNGRTITSKRARPNPNVRQVVKRETKILVNNALFADSDNSTPQQIRRGASISAFHIVKYWEREKHWKICRDEYVLTKHTQPVSYTHLTLPTTPYV